MASRSALSLILAVAALFALAAPALAGGWAITTVDTLPQEFRAGETYTIGFTILQHGTMPFEGAETEIRVISTTTRERHTFAGRPEGAKGHYVAEVRVPSAGEWRWEVQPGWFEKQDLGLLNVLPPLSAASGGSADKAAVSAPASKFAESKAIESKAVAESAAIDKPLAATVDPKLAAASDPAVAQPAASKSVAANEAAATLKTDTSAQQVAVQPAVAAVAPAELNRGAANLPSNAAVLVVMLVLAGVVLAAVLLTRRVVAPRESPALAPRSVN